MKPTIQTEQYELYLGDCRQILPFLEPVDLLLTDPPYGIGESGRKNESRENKASTRDYGENLWDKQPVETWAIEMARSKAHHQIIFGGNYYQLPPTSCLLVWDKQNTGDFADCEIAWTNLPKAIRIIHHMWNGMIRKGNEPRFHLTQKPLDVMAWALQQAPPDVQTVLDPFMGSGTTGVACIKHGRKFIGIEKEERYFTLATARLEAAAAQGVLFQEAEKAAA